MAQLIGYIVGAIVVALHFAVMIGLVYLGIWGFTSLLSHIF